MPQHDVIALDANYQNWRKERAAGLHEVEPFLYYSVEQITKRFNLTDEEVRYGITDHSNDGGIDAIYCLSGARHTLIRDNINTDIRSADAIRIMLFQAKSSTSETGFKPADIDRITFFLDDLLTLDRSAKALAHKYEDHLLTIMQTFKDRYLQLAGNFPRLIIEVYYIVRGDEEQVTPTVQDSIDRMRDLVAKHRGTQDQGNFEFFPVDTQALLKYVRSRRQRSRLLKWAVQPMPVGNSYVGLVKLEDYFNFLKDESGGLDELIFESNVRGNQGRSSVNLQMRATLDVGGDPDFWQLNNGITITSSALEPVDAYKIQVKDAQVVNGLQTSRQVFAHLKERQQPNVADERRVLVKLIAVSDDAARDKIIRATNNQNQMKAAALRATSDLHRDIEDLFKRYGLYYDRRPGFYKDQEVPIKKIVSLTEIVQGIVALVLHRPDDARGRPGNYLKEGKKGDEMYRQVFPSGRSRLPLGAYLKCVLIVHNVEEFLAQKPEMPRGERYNVIFYVAFHLVCVLSHNAAPTAEDILQIESRAVTQASLEHSLKVVSEMYQALLNPDENPDTIAKGTQLVMQLKEHLQAQYPISLRPALDKTTKVRTKKIRDVLKEGEIK